jgi:hypothetical protein
VSEAEVNQGMLSDSAESIPFGLKNWFGSCQGSCGRKLLVRCCDVFSPQSNRFPFSSRCAHSLAKRAWCVLLGGPVGVIEDNKQLSAVNLAPWDRGRLSKHWLESLGPLVPTMRRRADRRGKKKRRKRALPHKLKFFTWQAGENRPQHNKITALQYHHSPRNLT